MSAALSAFSAACWDSQQLNRIGNGWRATVASADARSSVAKANQRRASAMFSGTLVQHLAFLQRRSEDRANEITATRNLIRRRYDDILGYPKAREHSPDLDRCPPHISALRKDYEQIDVATWRVISARARTEEHNPKWCEATNDATGHRGQHRVVDNCQARVYGYQTYHSQFLTPQSAPPSDRPITVLSESSMLTESIHRLPTR
jgi:hypothetical protein